VAIRAYNFATIELRLKDRQGYAAIQHRADRPVLEVDVVELEDSHVGLTAVDARMRAQVLEKAPSKRCALRFPRRLGLRAMEIAALGKVRAVALATPMLAGLARALERLVG
jgi:hypothetical protein